MNIVQLIKDHYNNNKNSSVKEVTYNPYLGGFIVIYKRRNETKDPKQLETDFIPNGINRTDD